MRVVEALEGLVPPNGVIGVMSSRLGSIANNVRGRWEDRASKAALNMMMRSFAARAILGVRDHRAGVGAGSESGCKPVLMQRSELATTTFAGFWASLARMRVRSSLMGAALGAGSHAPGFRMPSEPSALWTVRGRKAHRSRSPNW